MEEKKEMEKSLHWYLHIDLDAFFASVEQLDNPDLRGKPVIVGGLPQDRRSVVSTASYEARKYGVHSAMPTFQAYKLCPQGIFVRGRMRRYAELSYHIMNIFRDYSPDVDQMSIDEAFIDLTGTEKLFGPPAETAAAIKKRVKEETGLTVSMGLASTKYLAKIASGLFKPDGFCHIKHGDEENFMLNLPLNKVWGLGPKSLEVIRSKGFNSTRDIYERDYDSLEFLFGKNMAGFLYNVVRGIEKSSFSRESKSHSISAETTFPYDLTDMYMIETELLELAQGVFFRLLKEEGFSRTAFVKIRYDDFSTSTVQETSERNIITLDSFYEIIKRLFEKRYQNGRGIRLLGVGFENIEKEEKPYQQDLFSNNDEKKQAVEKAILKLSKKHPEIKVQKARTLKALLCFLLIGLAGKELKAETKENELYLPPLREGPVALFDYDLNDKNHVDYSISGLWKAEFQGGLNLSFGNGTAFAFSPQLPLFKQEVELTSLLTLNDHWYFQADFADEFTKNTFAFGYKSEDLVRSFRLANRGITMSRGYSAQAFGYGLEGGNNQAPGIQLLLKPRDERWQADFLVRYDMTDVKSVTYYGMNRASDLTLSPADFLYGREFRFPEEAAELLSQIDGVYIESPSGSLLDSRGRSYRKLSRDEYAALASANRLFISKDCGGGKNSKNQIPAILISFESQTCLDQLLAALGSYSEPDTFLGRLQLLLGADGKYRLQDYSGPLKSQIEGRQVLVIQDDKPFSPFLCPGLYDTGSGEGDVSVQAGKSGRLVEKYKALSSQDFYTSLSEDFFNEKQSFTRILNSEDQSSVYPFASDCPEIYLGMEADVGLEIHAISYTPVKEILISKNAAGGSVQVYKNGILLPAATYNENTGLVDLHTSISPADKILITWQEESLNFASGALALGAAFKIKLLPDWDADLAITARQAFNQKDNYIYSENQKKGFLAISGGSQFKKNGFSISDKASLALLEENTAKGLLLYCWDDIWEAYTHNTEEEEAPAKKNLVRFSPADFSSYKVINVELDFSDSNVNALSDFTLIFDEDSGNALWGKTALALVLKNCRALNEALSSARDKRHNLKINLENSSVAFDQLGLEAAEYELIINPSVIPSRLMLEETGSGKNIYISKLTYEEAKAYGGMKNLLALEYKKEGSILKAGSFDLLKDLYVSSESSQGWANFSNPDFFVNSKSEASLTFSGIKLYGQLSSEKDQITYAGHSIKTDSGLFDFLYAEDSFNKDYYTDEVSKLNAFSLKLNKIKVPLQIDLKNTARTRPYLKNQDAELAITYTQPVLSSEFSLGVKLNAAQKILKESSTQKASYGEDWQKLSLLAYSNGDEKASYRKVSYAAYVSGLSPLGKSSYTVKPKLSYELSDNYNLSLPDTLFSDIEELKFTLPFTGRNNSFSFEISRSGGGINKPETGGSYYSDSEKLFRLQNQRLWFYSQLPFYELFDQQLEAKLPDKASYSAKYQANFRRSLYNSLKDLYIPSAFTLALEREVKTMNPYSDTYQIKALVMNNSINNFGSQSLNKSFSWFKQEELSTSLSTILKLPAGESQTCHLKIQAFAQLLLYISDRANLTEVLDISIENTADWNLRDTITYLRPSQTSLISELIRHFGASNEGAEKKDSFSVSRKDSFTFEIGQIEKNLRQKYEYSHTVSVDFLEYYSINASLGGLLILNQKSADSLSLSFSIGAKAEF